MLCEIIHVWPVTSMNQHTPCTKSRKFVFVEIVIKLEAWTHPVEVYRTVIQKTALTEFVRFSCTRCNYHEQAAFVNFMIHFAATEQSCLSRLWHSNDTFRSLNNVSTISTFELELHRAKPLSHVMWKSLNFIWPWDVGTPLLPNTHFYRPWLIGRHQSDWWLNQWLI